MIKRCLLVFIKTYLMIFYNAVDIFPSRVKNISSKMKYQHCGNEVGVYFYAILNGVEVNDCPKCHKRTRQE